MSLLSDNYQRVRDEFEEVCDRVGRRVGEVQLMAVSKTQPIEKIQEIYALGHRLFGENRVEEALEKRNLVPGDAEFHMIGQLQSNKAKNALFFHCIHSVDRISLASELEKRLVPLGQEMPVLIEVNTGGEVNKAGLFTWDELVKVTDFIVGKCPHLRVRGLMTMAPFTQDEKILRGCFQRLRQWRDRLGNEYPEVSFPLLSMGMSNDFKVAIEEGSTLVRIGTKIFEN